MKKRVFLALLAAAAVTFVGCSKDDDGPDEGPQTYTITFEGDDWSSLVVANYNGGKAMSVVYEDKAYTWNRSDHAADFALSRRLGIPVYGIVLQLQGYREVQHLRA